MRVLLWGSLALVLLTIVASHDIKKPLAGRLPLREPGARAAMESAAPVSDPTPPGKRVVCYYTNWSINRKGLAKFGVQNINPYLCTHLIYAYGGLNDKFELTVFDADQDLEKGGYTQFAALKKYNKNLRNLLAVGGWNEGSARFSKLASLPEHRQVFIRSTIAHLRRYNFDGLDLDWEFPASREGSMPEDKENYVLLAQEMREAFEDESVKSGRPRLILTMVLAAGKAKIDKGFDILGLNKHVDFFNILNYDYYTGSSSSVQNHAALLPPPGTSESEDTHILNAEWTLKYCLELGADRLKLVMGIPTYGRSFTLADPSSSKYGSAANGPGIMGNYTKEPGFMAFFEVCELMSVAGWKAEKPFPRAMGPYAHKGDQWVGYDDEGIVATKAKYVRDRGLGGIMFWSLDTEDFRGICNGRPNPLIEAGKEALLSDPAGDGDALVSGNKVTTPAPPTTPLPPTTPSTIPRD